MSRTVLVVDAYQETRAAYRKALEAEGYEVLEAGRGGEALAMIVLNVPDAVVMDISLPDMSGWDVLDQLKSDSGMDPLRVVVYSDHEAEAEAAAAEKGLGELEMLSKPVNLPELVAAVGGVLGATAESQEASPGPTGPLKLDEAISNALRPDEQVVVKFDALLKLASQFHTKCKLLLTDRRLLVLRQAWPWGYKITDDLPLETSDIVGHKERFDGSQTIVVRHGNSQLSFYLGRRAQEQGRAILGAFPKWNKPAV